MNGVQPRLFTSSAVSLPLPTGRVIAIVLGSNSAVDRPPGLFNPFRALSRCGHKVVEREPFRYPIHHSKPCKTCFGEYDSIKLTPFNLLHPCVNVSSDRVSAQRGANPS